MIESNILKIVDKESKNPNLLKESIIGQLKETKTVSNPLKHSLKTIENNSLEALKIKNEKRFENLGIARNESILANSKKNIGENNSSSIEKIFKKFEKEPSANREEVKVPYKTYEFSFAGKPFKIKVPVFKEHVAFSVKLPNQYHKEINEEQFKEATKTLRKQLETNEKETIKKLEELNEKNYERGKKIYEDKKDLILEAQNRMLEAKNNGDANEEEKWLKKLRNLTEHISLIETPKGNPFKMLTEKEALDKQISDITNPKSHTKGRIFGFEWHHKEEEGILELVPKDIHIGNRHLGGNIIWGDGMRR